MMTFAFTQFIMYLYAYVSLSEIKCFILGFPCPSVCFAMARIDRYAVSKQSLPFAC